MSTQIVSCSIKKFPQTSRWIWVGLAYIPPGKGFELAEAASGYNKTNCMSPVQGAMIAASVANDGQSVVPYLINSVSDENGKTLYEGSTLASGSIMTKESAVKIRELMGRTVLAENFSTLFPSYHERS